MRIYLLTLIWLLICLCNCRLAGAGERDGPQNLAGMRGVNLANALEAPREGDWGVVLHEAYFDAIKKAGFNLVRLPVAFAAHTEVKAPFKLSEGILARVEEILAWASARQLAVILAFHSYEDLYRDPKNHGERFIVIWEQIAQRFATRYANCLFGLLNEPHGNLTAPVWNDLLAKTVQRIRQIDAVRTLVLGGSDYSDVRSLDALDLPDGEENIIATFHYYRPFEFTHQGASWVANMDQWLGSKWSGDEKEIKNLREDFLHAADWSRKTGRPVFLEEFGCIAKAPPVARGRWTEAVRREAELRGFGWAYWDFCAGFGIYDPIKGDYDDFMLESLMKTR